MGTTLIRRMRRTVGLIWVALVLVIVSLAAIGAIAPRLGYQVFVIRGSSMEHGIPLGSLVAVQRVDPESLAKDDVVSIQSTSGAIYTHRIVAIDALGSERLFQLRGDANTSADAALVPASAVIGRVVIGVPVLGYLVAFLSLGTGVISILSGLASLMLSYRLLTDLELELMLGAGSVPDPSQGLVAW